jgi:hypothetical protein
VIEAEKAIYTVSRMCGLLEVSRSGFYKWRKSRHGGPSPSRQRRAELDAKVWPGSARAGSRWLSHGGRSGRAGTEGPGETPVRHG